MTSIADGSVIIRASSESVASTPSWFGEVVLMTAHLRKHDVLTKIAERVRFARRRFGYYEVIDFLAVLFGYVISGERTLEEFYMQLQPVAGPFMAGAGAVSMEWFCDGKAASGERAVTSAPGGFCPAPLARLEPQSPPACLYPARAAPTPRSEPVASRRHFAPQRGRDPLPCAARALASLVGRAARSQCAL